MNESDQRVVSACDPIAAIVFYTFSVLLFPVTLVGYLLWGGKSLLAGRKSGVSGTAQAPLAARWFEHHFGTRRDELANRLMLALPGVPQLGLRLVADPILHARRVSGYVPRDFRYPVEGEIPVQ
jgi:hypothetical protein